MRSRTISRNAPSTRRRSWRVLDPVAQGLEEAPIEGQELVPLIGQAGHRELEAGFGLDQEAVHLAANPFQPCFAFPVAPQCSGHDHSFMDGCRSMGVRKDFTDVSGYLAPS